MLRENPTCPVCMQQGILSAATETDHIVAHKGDKALFFDGNNLWTLCKTCHASKSAAERNGKAFETQIEWVKYLIDR